MRSEADVDAGPLVDAMTAAGLAVTVCDVDRHGESAIYDRALTLVRPDQHVAWRGDALPADVAALADHVRGAAAEGI